MDGEDEYINVSETTKSHRHSEGTDIRKSLHIKTREISGLSAKQIHKIILQKYDTPRIILFLWGWFAFQFVLAPLLGYTPITGSGWNSIFILSKENFFSIALFTSMVGHGNFIHILVNSVVFYSFGSNAEKFLKRTHFVGLLVMSGLMASTVQIWLPHIFSASSPGLVGFSGAIAGVIGAVTVQHPEKKMYLMFFIPVRMWVGVVLFIGGSSLAVIFGGFGAFGIAHIAHITGLLIGVVGGFVLPESYKHPTSIDLRKYIE